MNHETIAAYIADGKAVLGIEFGSTRIKAVLIGDDHAPIASGDHTWENRLEDGIWTYHLNDVWAGVQDAFANLQKDVQANYGVTLTNLAAFGVSGMMHGFLAFDENGRQLAQFRTWRNTMTAQAAEKLTALLGFNIPQRWSIAHLVQAMMNGEAMVPQIHHLTTLAGYVHYQLCGKNCLGIGEAACSPSTAMRWITTSTCWTRWMRWRKPTTCRGRCARFCRACYARARTRA